jgi:hypothetical protein
MVIQERLSLSVALLVIYSLSAHIVLARYDVITFESKILEGNPLNDTNKRETVILFPPGVENITVNIIINIVLLA